MAVRDAGFSDGQIVEIIAVVAENIFTNLLNVVADTDINFPVVRASDAACSPPPSKLSARALRSWCPAEARTRLRLYRRNDSVKRTLLRMPYLHASPWAAAVRRKVRSLRHADERGPGKSFHCRTRGKWIGELNTVQ
jgi:hypothetical protein